MYGRKRAPFVVGIAANGSRLSIGERLWGGEKVPSGIFVVSSFYAMTVARSLEPRHGLESPSFFSQTQERNEKPIIIIIMKKNTSIGRRSPLSVGCPHLPSSSDAHQDDRSACARERPACVCAGRARQVERAVCRFPRRRRRPFATKPSGLTRHTDAFGCFLSEAPGMQMVELRYERTYTPRLPFAATSNENGYADKNKKLVTFRVNIAVRLANITRWSSSHALPGRPHECPQEIHRAWQIQKPKST